MTEQIFWSNSTNLDILTNCMAAMSVTVKLNYTEQEVMEWPSLLLSIF
jgi:hypothetical protein